MIQEEPLVYKITKVKNTSPKGIITFTVKQDKYEPDHDYVCLNTNSEDYGDMYADYYSSTVLPENKKEDFNYNEHTAVIESANGNVRIGTSKVLAIKIYDIEKNDITNEYSGAECIWEFDLEQNQQTNLIVVDNEYSSKENNEFKCKFKFIGDEQYIGNNINVSCTVNGMSANTSLNIIAL